MKLKFKIKFFKDPGIYIQNIDDYTDFDFKLFKNYLSRNELKKINRIRILEKQYLKILSRFMIKNIVKNDFGSDELNCFEVLNNMGDIGQPVLFFKNKVTSMSVSMSYSSPLVAVEVYEKQEGGSIGIDIEKIFKNISSEFLEYCFTSKELESISKIFKQTTFECSCTMLWCIKESVGKLFSIGLSGNPKKIEILFKNLNEFYQNGNTVVPTFISKTISLESFNIGEKVKAYVEKVAENGDEVIYDAFVFNESKLLLIIEQMHLTKVGQTSDYEIEI